MELQNNESFDFEQDARTYAELISKYHTDTDFHVIKCRKSYKWYVCTDGLIRMFEELISIYNSGKILEQ